jgi:hypothetical protein
MIKQNLNTIYISSTLAGFSETREEISRSVEKGWTISVAKSPTIGNRTDIVRCAAPQHPNISQQTTIMLLAPSWYSVLALEWKTMF